MMASGGGAARLCAAAGLAAGAAIRDAVYAIPPGERARPASSLLKHRNVEVDARAEAVGLDHLRALASRIDRRLLLLTDDRGGFETIGDSSNGEAVWAYFDAIDGTKKMAGIRPHAADRIDAANDGAWAATFAFTRPTAKTFDELTLGDFEIAVVVDGNPTVQRAYPAAVMTLPAEEGVVAYEVDAAGERRVYTTTCTELNQCWLFLDSFQAYDRNTALPGDEDLAIELYRRFIDRHAPTGAHDVLRQFGSLSALCRTMLGWREPPTWVESQGGAFLVINENLPNLVPSVPLIRGAGGFSVDFDGRSLLDRRLAEGRTSVIHAANAALRDHCVAVVCEASSSPAGRG